MTTKRYPDIEPGQEIGVDWKNNELHMACCDCNLVHVLQFRVAGKKVIVQAWRHNRATATLRRYRGIPIYARLTKKSAEGKS